MLADRTFHPDEANQALTTGKLLETGAYAYQPNDHHGPTLYYAGAALQKAAGHADTATLDGSLLRCTPLLFAFLALVFGALAVRKILAGAKFRAAYALSFALLLCTAPAFAFFSTFYIQEMLLACFLAMAFWAAFARNGFYFGVATGLAFATKETSLLSFAAAFAAYAVANGRDSFRLPRKATQPVVAIATFALVAATLYSSFGSNWQGLWDAIVAMPAAYLHRAAGDAAAGGAANHVHPWFQHLKWIFCSGWRFSELALLLPVAAALAKVNAVDAASPAAAARKPFVFAAVYTAALAAIYSAIPYKTPWCDLQIVLGLATAAALALPLFRSRALRAAFVALVLAFHVPGLAFMNAKPDSKEIPFNYANSSPDVVRAAELVEKAMSGAAADDFVAVGVPAEDSWPLPWYMRRLLARTGYWTSIEELKAVAEAGGRPKVVIVPESRAEEAMAIFPHLKNSGIYATRPRVLITVLY